MKNLSRKEYVVLFSFIMVKLLLHFFTNSNYDLHRDTFLYYSLSQNLDWGYASVPPFIAILTRLATFLFGYSAFALNLFPAIAGAVSLLLIALIVKELGGKTMAIFISSLAFLMSPAYLRSNSLMQPVSFDQMFWLLSAYFIVRLINTQNTKFWFLVMMTWAVGFMNKYLIAGYAFSLVIGLLISKHRKLLFSKDFVFSGILAFIIVLPNLLWQYNHNWPVVHHLSELNKNQLVNVSMTGFLVDQLLMNFPALIVWATGLLVFLFLKNERKFLLLSLASLFVILLLLFTHGKSYYTLGAYTLLMAMGGYAIERYYPRFLRFTIIGLVFILSLPLLPFSLPVLSLPDMARYSSMMKVTNRWEDGKVHPIPQDYADMTGWKELSEMVVTTYKELPSDVQENCNIFAENYGQAGAILLYGRDSNIPQPICFSDNFIFWAPDSIQKDYLIYINDEPGDIKNLFKKYEVKAEIHNPYFREDGVKVYLCSEPVDSFKYFYNHKVKEIKSIYKRQ